MGTALTSVSLAGASIRNFIDPARETLFFDDMEYDDPSALASSSYLGPWKLYHTGTSSQIGVNSNHLAPRAGSDATGAASIYSGSLGFALTSLSEMAVDMRVQCITANSGGFAHDAIFGLATAGFSYAPTSGIYFRSPTGGGNWSCITRNSSTETATDSGVAVSTSSFYRLRIEWNGTNVKFYINGSLVATHTTNIPSSIPTLTRMVLIDKTGSAGLALILIDYYRLYARWSAGR